MQLLYSPTSPYARKVRVVAIERGLTDRIEMVAANPLGEDTAALRAKNPLGKIPTLVLDDGTTLFDSPVICEYLDALAAGPRLLAESGAERWACLRAAALADGVMDAAFSLVMEGRRPDLQRSHEWRTRWRQAIVASTAQFGPASGGAFDLGQVGMACAWGYLNFRLPEIAAEAVTPQVRDWWARVSERRSIAQTTPPAG